MKIRYATGYRVLIANDADPRGVAERGSTVIEEIEVFTLEPMPTLEQAEYSMRWAGVLQRGQRVVLVSSI